VSFHLAVVVDGALTGALYAPVALAFVVVYRASGVINFALGEWTMLGAALTATGLWALGLDLPVSLGIACLAMIAFGLAFNRVVLRPLQGRPVVALIMVTLGLGALMRGAGAIVFSGVSGRIASPLSAEPLAVRGVLVATDKLAAATAAAVTVALTTWFFQRSRAGLALRAIADDQEIALSMGIDVHRHLALAWGVVGVLSVLAGTLWTVVSSAGFGVALLGLKVFPIVIIGGLDSIPGALVGAILVGVLESLAAAYLGPWMGAGISTVASYLVLVAVLFVRPTGLFGQARVARA
jgi:branched-chain amino acid transport system permease protein